MIILAKRKVKDGESYYCSKCEKSHNRVGRISRLHKRYAVEIKLKEYKREK